MRTLTNDILVVSSSPRNTIESLPHPTVRAAGPRDEDQAETPFHHHEIITSGLGKEIEVLLWAHYTDQQVWRRISMVRRRAVKVWNFKFAGHSKVGSSEGYGGSNVQLDGDSESRRRGSESFQLLHPHRSWIRRPRRGRYRLDALGKAFVSKWGHDRYGPYAASGLFASNLRHHGGYRVVRSRLLIGKKRRLF